jgi:ATP-dependent DNA ligase
VILGAAGRSDFNCISASITPRCSLCAFDVLAIGGDDLRALPLSMRKTNLERLRIQAGRLFFRHY